MLINGLPGNTISATDRGLLYGDGVFRTMRLSGGRTLHWPRHYQKLQHDCAALLLPCPDARLLEAELAELTWGQAAGVVRLTLTRGTSARGYAPPVSASPTRILSLSPVPVYPAEWATDGVGLHLCQLQLAAQPRLAGIKHLNRLENVLAAAEWNDPALAEGLLQDEHGRVISGTRSNLFIVRHGTLHTPDLSRCGVAGMQRERVLDWAQTQGIPVQVRALTLAEVLAADELFLTNSLIGAWPVRALLNKIWAEFPLTRRIQAALESDDV